MSTYIYEEPLVRQPKTVYRELKHALLVMKGKNSTSYFELFRICTFLIIGCQLTLCQRFCFSKWYHTISIASRPPIRINFIRLKSRNRPQQSRLSRPLDYMSHKGKPLAIFQPLFELYHQNLKRMRFSPSPNMPHSRICPLATGLIFPLGLGLTILRGKARTWQKVCILYPTPEWFSMVLNLQLLETIGSLRTRSFP